jgi:hypothetical protein
MKTYRKNSGNGREGGILVMVVLVVLVFSVLAIGLFKLHETTAVEAVFFEHYKQAFWLAEAGLADGELIVRYDEDFRNNQYAIDTTTNTVVKGSYDIDVVKTAIDASLRMYDYEITSIGNVNGVRRRLRSIVSSRPGGEHAIIVIGDDTGAGELNLAANVEVNGPIAVISGDANVHDSRYLDGYMIMPNGELTDKKGEVILVDYPPPPPPTIVQTGYAAALAKVAVSVAEVLPGTNVTESVISGVSYYNSPYVNILGTATAVADGTVIIATGDLSFTKSHVSIGNNVTIIANSVTIANQVEIGGGTVIYATEDLHINNASDNTIEGEAAVVLLSATGDIIMDSNIDFRGIMLAEEGGIEINANGTIEGTIIGGTGVDVNANTTITYDESVFTSGTPIIPKLFDSVIITSKSWQEIPIL